MFRHTILIASIFGFYFMIAALLSRLKISEESKTAKRCYGCLADVAAEKMAYQPCELFSIVLVYSLLTRADKLLEEFKAQMFEGFTNAADNIHREDEVRVRMAEYKTLQYVAHYLASDGKTLDAYGLLNPNTYSDVSAEVDGPTTESIVQQKHNAYSHTDLDHVTERVDQLSRNQLDVFDQVVHVVEHPVGGEKLRWPGWNWEILSSGTNTCACLISAQNCYCGSFQRYCGQGVCRTLDVSNSSLTNGAFHMQSFLAKSKSGTDPKRQLNYLRCTT
ncbi:Helitron helicase [Phytophthora megakarya]|uniref:Helitron helicase n=1 Tax=Phytophthora megakarya TaxID=4795 RepID=A0A225UKH2_9STRA|nr:Helitron helicase [Phytophthora megakarya]